MAEDKKGRDDEHLLVDQLKPGAEFEMLDVPEEMQEVDHMCRLMAEMAKAEGVEYTFGVTAGAEWPMEGLFLKSGIKRVHVRHEMTATFAGDAMARVSRRPSCPVIGPSTGLTNASSGVAQAMAAQSPMVVLCGEHPEAYDRLYFAQGLVKADPLFNGIAKDVTRVCNPAKGLMEFKKAFINALTPPTGPVVVAIPWDTGYQFSRQPRTVLHSLYTPGNFTRTERHLTREDPALVERAVKWLLEAEKPVIVTGEGVWYDEAEEELNEFVKLTGIPTHCRRLSRGAIDEYDPLNCGGRARGRTLRNSDRCMVMGLRIAYLEMHGAPPFWSHDTRYVQVQTCTDNFDMVLPTEFGMVGNMKAILRQMIECAKEMGVTGPLPKWEEWRQFVADAKEEYEKKTLARTEKMFGKTPVHPDLVGRLAYEFLRDELNDDYYAVIDGFTASSFFTDWHKMRYPGRVLDASETIGIGHGVGMAIGGALASKCEKPFFVVMGDGALGACMGDIETAVRWNIPAVFFHENNNTMVAGGWQLFWSKACSPTGNELLDSWQTLPNIRYDKMMAEFGCHTEFCQEDKEIKPALKRAFDYVRREKKPAFVEVFVEPMVMNEIWSTFLTACCGFLEWEDIPEEGKKAIKELGLVDPSYRSFCPTWPEEALAIRRRKK